MLAKTLQTAVKGVSFFAVLGISTLISCSEEGEPVKPDEGCFPISLTMSITDEDQPENNSHLKHTYVLDNENKILTETVEDLIDGSENHVVTYTYDNADRLITIDKDFATEDDTRKELLYSGDHIAEIRFQGLTESKYQYNAKGRLIEVKQYYPECSGDPLACSAALIGAISYEYENDESENPAIARYSTGDWMEISYDDKNGIAKLFPAEVVVPYYNNPVRFVIKNETGDIISTQEFSYEYNAQNYPIKMTVHDGTVNESFISYKCL